MEGRVCIYPWVLCRCIPTVTYILWAIPLRKGELPKVSEALATRLGWIVNIELGGFCTGALVGNADGPWCGTAGVVI